MSMHATQPGSSASSATAAPDRKQPLPLLAIAVLLMLAGLIAVVAMVRSQASPSRQTMQATHAEQMASGTSGASVASGTRTDKVKNADNAEVRQLRVLRFDDAPDGSVAAIDVSTGELVQRFEGEQGFLRGTLRAMARQRRMNGLGAGQPFELILLRDGRLTLRDPATGMRIALESFGATNTGVFARLLR